MDPNALYYAFSTIAQCAAALAALIGFFGLWRLDRHREEVRQCEQEIVAVTILSKADSPQTAQARGRGYYLEFGRPLANQGHAELTPLYAHLDTLPGEQQRLLWALCGFLLLTLMILGAAVVGFLYVDRAKDWIWTPRLLWIAGFCLAGSPIVVVLVAARLPRALVVLALLLVLTSPAMAGPTTHCTTYEEKMLNRLHTLCDDGTRAVSRYNTVLQRWETTITASPRKVCAGQLNPRTQQVEVRCH